MVSIIFTNMQSNLWIRVSFLRFVFKVLNFSNFGWNLTKLSALCVHIWAGLVFFGVQSYLIVLEWEFKKIVNIKGKKKEKKRGSVKISIFLFKRERKNDTCPKNNDTYPKNREEKLTERQLVFYLKKKKHEK